MIRVPQRIWVFALCVIASMNSALYADDAPRSPRDVAKIIDGDIMRHLVAEKLSPAPRTDDIAFLRRAYLDINGRIPTAKEAAEFLDNRDPGKRAKLIDALLASPHYGEQFGRTWRDWIAPAELPSEGNGGNQPIKQTQDMGRWFGERFNAGDGWDTIVRSVLTVEGTLKQQPQGLFFSLVGDDQGRPQPGGAARAITSLFLGVQMQCAECHDDPFKDWTQADFWGTAAFFRNMTWKFNGRYFDSIAESFETPGKGGRSNPGPRDGTPNGKIAIPKEAFKNVGKIIPAKFINGTEMSPAEKQALRPVFTDWLLSRDNPYFARAFVNRTWWYFFARGLVDPVDDLRDDNPPSHPVVMDELTREFVASKYDVRHLVRCIVNTEAYQRSSRPLAANQEKTRTAFGVMPVRLMAADVFYDSLRLALNDPKLDLRTYDPKDAQRFGESSPVGQPYDEFVRLFNINKDRVTDFTHGIPQFLALVNHPRIRSGGKTPDELIKAKSTPDQAIESLYLGALSRRPTEEERADALRFLASVSDTRRGFAGLLWALVNSSEFLLVR